MTRPPTRSTRTDPSVPYTTLFRAGRFAVEPPRLPLQRPPQPMPWRHGFRTRAVLRVLPVASVATAPRTWWKITVDRLVSQLRHQRHAAAIRSEEHTSELQSLMRISYAVFCFQNKKHKHTYAE